MLYMYVSHSIYYNEATCLSFTTVASWSVLMLDVIEELRTAIFSPRLVILIHLLRMFVVMKTLLATQLFC